MTLPAGIEEVTIGGETRLATEGPPVYGEPTVDGWRVWGAGRSKLAAMIEVGLPVQFDAATMALYLGAGAGTTVSHLADALDRVYAVEFAPRPGRRLLTVAKEREAIIPLLKDARRPETYSHVVESDCGLLVQDLATVDQARIAAAHRPFLADGATVAVSIKARSEDVTAEVSSVFETALEVLDETYDVVEHARLEPYHDDHLGIVARVD